MAIARGMPGGLDAFADDLEQARARYADLGPGAYHVLIEGVAELLASRPEALAGLAEAWQGRHFEAWFERVLLLLAGLRYRALEERDKGGTHPLESETLANVVGPSLPRRLKEALADPGLSATLATRSVQTNEPGRAIGWGLVAAALRIPHKGFSLVDVGCSAGLSLVADLTPLTWKVGTMTVSGLDFPSPGRRLGLDREPGDVSRPETVRWLRACIWPGDAERRQRLEASLEAWERAQQMDSARARPQLRSHRIGEDPIGPVLADLFDGKPVIVFEALVRDYLSPASLAAHTTEMYAWLAAEEGHVWLTLEPDDGEEPGGPVLLTAHLARGGEIRALPLARTGYHPSTCTPIGTQLETLTMLWRSR